MSNTPPLRILHVISNLSPGGAEKVVLDLAGHQTSAGHEATILSPVDLKTAQVRPTPAGVCMMFLSATPLDDLQNTWLSGGLFGKTAP